MPQFSQPQFWEIRKYLHDEDMEDYDIQSKENEEDEEEPTGINSLMNKHLQGQINMQTIIFSSATTCKDKYIFIY